MKQHKSILTTLLFLLLVSFLWGSTVYQNYPESPGYEVLELEWLEEIHNLVPPGPEIQSPSGILFDAETGLILFEKNSDWPIPPASLTKLMTIHLVLNWAEEHGVDWDDRITYSPAAYAENAPPRSSLMFLGAGQITSLRELLLGLSISSGNDAAVAAAELVAGSVSSFVGAMNNQSRVLGLGDTYFEEPSGYSQFNQTTVRDFARFLAYYLQRWPSSLEVLHAPLDFTYPTRDNLEPGATSRFLGITQPNRNGLVANYPGADGFKTGFIDQAGYNLAFTAQRNGFRLVGVVLGGMAPSTLAGSALREGDAASLLDYGFGSYALRTISIPETAELRVWGSREKYMTIPSQEIRMPLPVGVTGVEIHRILPRDIAAPVPRGAFVSQQLFMDQNGKPFAQLPLYVPLEIEEVGGFRMFWDRLVLFFRGLLGKPAPVELGGKPASVDLGA